MGGFKHGVRMRQCADRADCADRGDFADRADRAKFADLVVLPQRHREHRGKRGKTSNAEHRMATLVERRYKVQCEIFAQGLVELVAVPMGPTSLPAPML